MPLPRFLIEHAAVPSPAPAADRAATSTSTHRVFRTSARLPDGARGGPAPPASVSGGRRLPVPPSGANDGARVPARIRLDAAHPPLTGIPSAGASDRMRFRLQRTPRGGGGSDHDDAAAAGVGVFGVVRSDGGAPAPIARSSRPPPSLRRATSSPRVGTDPIASGEGGGAPGGGAQSPALRMSNIERLLAPRRERRTKSPMERLSASLADADATPLPVFDQLRSSRDLEIRRGSARRNGSVGCFPAAVITLRESSSLCLSPTPLASMLDCSAVLLRERVHVYFKNVV